MSMFAPLGPVDAAASLSLPSGGLALHGIAHLSPSSINAYVAQPAAWLMERLLQRRAPVGSAAHRGTAVEAGRRLPPSHSVPPSPLPRREGDLRPTPIHGELAPCPTTRLPHHHPVAPLAAP